jgi:hypothetical protein
LDALDAELEELYERMQQPEVVAAMARAFAYTPAELGRAAARAAQERASADSEPSM